MIKNVLFDLDDTILDFGKCESVAVSDTFRRIGIEPSSEIVIRYSRINDMHWKKLEKKELTRQQVLVGRFEMLFDELGISFSGNEANEIYKRCLGKQSFFIDGALHLLECLHSVYNLYIVSNGTATVQDSRIEKAGIAGYFREIFISERIGVNKPDVRFFEKCFEKIPHFIHEETVIIGDSLSSDMKGGENAGIKTIWYNPKSVENNMGINIWKEVDSLECIPDILKSL